MRKKALSLVLSLCMVLSLLPMTAFAADVTGITATVEALETPTEGSVKLTIALTPGDATAGVDSKIIYQIVSDDNGNAPTAPTGQVSGDDIGTTWTEYTDSTGEGITLTSQTDGKYVIAAYVTQNESETTKYDIKNTAVTKIDDGYPVAVTGVTVAPTSLSLEVGKTGTLTATVAPEDATDKTVTWTSSDATVATVAAATSSTTKANDVTGESVTVTALKAGSATITATAGDKTATCTVTVTAAKATPVLTTKAVTVDYGTKLGDIPTTGFEAKSASNEDVDGAWSIVPGDNQDANTILDAGTYTVTAKFTPSGDDYGEATKTFSLTVSQKEISVESATVAEKVYDGTTTGTVSAVTFTGATLTSSDYTATAVFQSANVANSVTADVTVTLKGDAAKNYTLGSNNTTTAQANITAKEITATVSLTADNDTIQAGTKVTAKVTASGIVSEDTVDYTYTWKVGGSSVTTGVDGANYTLQDSDTTGDVSVTVALAESSNSNSNANYTMSEASAQVTIGKTILKDEHVTLTFPADATYDGTEKTATVSVAVNGTNLTETTNYTVTGDNLAQTDAGTYTVTVTGAGDYTGTVTKTFTIAQAASNISDISVTLAAAADADNHTKQITVTTDGTVSVASSDTDVATVSGVTGASAEKTFTITAVADGTATITVTVTGNSNYTDLASSTIAVTVGNGGTTVTPPPSGGNGSGGTTPPVEPDPDPDPNPTPSEDVTETVTPEVSEGTASATVDKETADKIVSDAVDNKSENVTVKVDVPADADVNEVKAELPASAVADLASKTDANLTVDTPVANVTIPNESLTQLGASSGNVTVTATVADDNSVKVEIQRNGTTVDTLNGGMKVDLPAANTTTGTVAVLVNADGTETIIPKSVVNGSEVAVLLDGSATIKLVDNSKQFDDMGSHWAKNAAAFTSSRNLFKGVSDTQFAADTAMSRAMLATVLYRMENEPSVSGGSFADVPADSYYADAAAWAAGKGIVTGDGTGFNGNRDITREEMAVMFYRYVQTINGNKGTLGSYSNMTDASQVSSWASEAMRWAVGSGVMKGTNTGALNPKGSATRGEVSQMVMNFVQLITK